MRCEYSQPKLRVMFYSLRIFKTLNPGGSTSSSPERIAPRQGEKPGYIEVLQQRTGSLNIRLPQWLSSKESACNAGDAGLIPGSGRSPVGGYGNPPQYSCLNNPMDREA